MKRVIMTMVAMVMMISVSAQRIDNANMGNKVYVYNIYAKYPSTQLPFGGKRANKPVTLPMPKGQRPVNIGTPQQPNKNKYNKNSSKPSDKNNSPNRGFGSMRR